MLKNKKIEDEDLDDDLEIDDDDELDDEEDEEEIDTSTVKTAEIIAKHSKEIAKLLGHNSLDEAIEAAKKKKLEESGIDEDGYKAVLEALKADPQWQAFEAFKEQNKYMADLTAFNNKYKTSFTTTNITAEVRTIIEGGGLSFEAAMLAKYPDSNKKSAATGKEHLKEHKGSTANGRAGSMSREDEKKLIFFRSVNPTATKEQELDFLKKVGKK